MKIIAAVAVLLGLASAKTNLKSISGDYSTSTGMVDPYFSWEFALDYSTVYDSGLDSTSDFIVYESYGINAASSASVSFGLDFFGAYKYGMEIAITLFDITPYRQIIQWVNPIALLNGAATQFDIGLRGEYDVYLAEIQLTHLQSMWQFSYDLADWFQTTVQGTTTAADLVPTSSNWSFDDDDFDSSIFSFTLADYVGAWYGSQSYYQTSLSGYITASV